MIKDQLKVIVNCKLKHRKCKCALNGRFEKIYFCQLSTFLLKFFQMFVGQKVCPWNWKHTININQWTRDLIKVLLVPTCNHWNSSQLTSNESKNYNRNEITFFASSFPFTVFVTFPIALVYTITETGHVIKIRWPMMLMPKEKRKREREAEEENQWNNMLILMLMIMIMMMMKSD